jgi:hypothetical protein
LFNVNKYGATGAQFAGLFNVTATGNSEFCSSNVQFAGLFNHTKKGKSTQFAGLENVGDTAYLQIAGIFNSAKQASFQGAGIFNVAKKSSCQIAGILNITKKGRFQMGLINVRDTADGVSLGLINIVKHGGVMEAGIEAGEFVHTALTFRSWVQRLYSIISVGYNYTEKFWAVGTGLGTNFKLVGNLGLNVELTHATLYKTNIFGWYSLNQLSLQLNYRVVKHFKIYAGPSFNILLQSDWLKSEKPQRLVKPPYTFYNKTTNNNSLDLWVGVVGGVKF